VVKPGDELRGNAACAIFSGIDRLPLAAVLSMRQWISTGCSGKTAVHGIFNFRTEVEKDATPIAKRAIS
jgi:hypothetical protein